MAGKQATVARSVFCAALTVALTLGLAAPVGSVTKRFKDHPGGAKGPHNIVQVVVDNTGNRIGVRVRHQGRRWAGRVLLRLDTGARRGFEHVVTIRHAGGSSATFENRNGSRWRCGDRRAVSRPGQRFTQLTFRRTCAAGRAQRMSVTAIVDPRSGRNDRLRTAAVPRVAPPPSPRQTPPNVLMLVVDDMRMDDLFAMPRTRRWLGRGGTEWTNALSPYPLCCPARASIYTGEYTHNHDVLSHLPPYGFNSFDDSSTLATWLDGAGYKTSFLGKYLNGWGSQPPHGETEGDSLRYFPPGWDDWRGAPDGHGVYRYWGTQLSQNRGRGLTTLRGYQSTAYGSIASEMIRGQAASTTPFFTQVSFTAPHHGQPREAGRDPGPVTRDDGDVTDLVTPASPQTTRDTFDEILAAPGAGWSDPDMTDMPQELRDVPPPNTEELTAMAEVHRQRLESLAATDLAIDQMMRQLESTGELGRTYVMFTSDNGYFLGEHGIRAGKVLPYDAALRVPLLIRGPGIPAGQVRHDPFLTTDLAPTVMQMAGLEIPDSVDGAGMLPVAEDGDLGWTRPVLVNTGPGSTVRNTDESGVPLDPEDPGSPDARFLLGVRTARYLYLDRADGFEELYDLEADPNAYENLVENHDLGGTDGPNEAADPADDDLLAVMRSQLFRVRACAGATCRVSLPDEYVVGP